MIAKIVMDNKEFYSHIFAKFNSGWKESVVVFDSQNRQFHLVNVYRMSFGRVRQVFVIDTDSSGMKTKNVLVVSLTKSFSDCIGYPWLLNNCALIRQILSKKTVDEKYIKIAEEQNQKMEIAEWHIVKNKKDAEDLLTTSWGFHDAKIAKISYDLIQTSDAPPSTLEVLFENCCNCSIVLRFVGDYLLHLNCRESGEEYMFSSNILFHNGFVYWVDDDVKTVEEIAEENIYFRARTLTWKIISE